MEKEIRRVSVQCLYTADNFELYWLVDEWGPNGLPATNIEAEDLFRSSSSLFDHLEDSDDIMVVENIACIDIPDNVTPRAFGIDEDVLS